MAWGGKAISYLAGEEAPGASNPTLLLIHGSGVSARSWTEQLRGLGESLQVLAIDLPDHGESDPIPEATVEAYAEAARGFLDLLERGPVFVAGHSLGGAVALALAARHQEMVKGLVLLSTCARLPETEGTLEGIFWQLPGPIRKLLFFSAVKRVLFAPGAPSRAVRLGMEEIRTCRPETILKDVAAAKAMNLEEVAQRIRIPTLILCGSRDRLTPAALSERLNELIPGSRLHILEGAGHMLPLEAPDWVNQRILDFVASVTPHEMRRLPLLVSGTARSILRRLLDKVKALWNRSALKRGPALPRSPIPGPRPLSRKLSADG